jgi:hypothetical protein
MIIYLIIITAVVSRFVPHPVNFAPITAIAIFSAYHLGWKQAVGLTLVIRLVSDLFLGLVAWPMMVAIYASHLVGVLLGVWVKNSSQLPPIRQAQDMLWKRGGVSTTSPSLAKEGVGGVMWLKIITSSLGASVIFFLVTNFAFLYSNYSHNLSGIIESYINGLPFLRGTLMGDLVYSVVLFGGLALVEKYQIFKIKSPNFKHQL